ncbi:MAG: ABC transporter substrate-binding protein [Candidatus Ranarchaeia archaeon]
MATERRFTATHLIVAVIIVGIAAAGVVYFIYNPIFPLGPEETVITVALSGSEITLDAQGYTGAVHQTVCLVLYDRIVELANNGSIVPGLATWWQAVDNGTHTIWTFRIREGVKFHSGLDLNATHVMLNFKRILDEKLTHAYRNFNAIIDLEAPNATTFVAITNGTYSPLLTSFAYVTGGISNPYAIEQYADNYTYHIDATGPYKLESYTPGQEIVVVANDEYWGNAPQVDKIIFKVVSDSAARNVALQTGQADVGDLLGVTDLPILRANPDLSVTVLYERSVFFWININKTPDRRMRQALNYAVNKTAIVEDIFGGDAQITNTPIPPFVRFAKNQTPYYVNKTKAMELIAASGWDTSKQIVIATTYGRYPLMKEVTEFIQSELEDVGLNTTILVRDFGAHISAVKKPANESDWNLAVVGWGTSTGDPDYICKSWYYGPNQAPVSFNAFYQNETVDAYIELGANQTDDSARQAAYGLVQDMVWQDAVMLFLYTMPEVYAVRLHVLGVEFMGSGAINLLNVSVNATAVS